MEGLMKTNPKYSHMRVGPWRLEMMTSLLMFTSFIWFWFSLITLCKEVFYVSIKFIICVYVNILWEEKRHDNHSLSAKGGVYQQCAHDEEHRLRSITSCTFCRRATMFVRSFCNFSSASFSLSSVLLFFSSTALALASALLWYELHNDCRPDSYCWKYSFYMQEVKKQKQISGRIQQNWQENTAVNIFTYNFNVNLCTIAIVK